MAILAYLILSSSYRDEAELQDRTKKLCRAWDTSLLVMAKLPSSPATKQKLEQFYTRVREGMKSR